MQIKKAFLNCSHENGKKSGQQVQALLFLPESPRLSPPTFALFTHGFTDHKASLLNWSTRLAQEGVASLLFDLPGHYLGGFSEVKSWIWFKEEVHKLYEQAHQRLGEEYFKIFPSQRSKEDRRDIRIVLGGHSLGGLLALKALGLESFEEYPHKLALAVGFGFSHLRGRHLFETPLFEKTLFMRAQLVSPKLNPQRVFAWIKEEKENLKITGQKIYLLSGKDDYVVGERGVQEMAHFLEAQNNEIHWERVAKLPHHNPQRAAPHLKKYLKIQGYLPS